MKAATPQYQDFIQSVEITATPEEQKIIRRYYITAMVLRVISICSLLLVFFLITAHGFVIITDSNKTKSHIYTYIFAFVPAMVYGIYRASFSKKVQNVLLQECDPNRVLSLYSTLVSYAKNRNWEIHFYNLAQNLYYAGRFEDAEKVQSLLLKYCPSNKGKLYYEMIGIDLAIHRQDLEVEDVTSHCLIMAELGKKVKLKGTMYLIYSGKMRYPMCFQLFRDKKYEDLYNGIKIAITLKNSLLTEVKRNYYLYKVALLLGDNEKAEEHKKFVMQNGGTLWYPKEL